MNASLQPNTTWPNQGSSERKKRKKAWFIKFLSTAAFFVFAGIIAAGGGWLIFKFIQTPIKKVVAIPFKSLVEKAPEKTIVELIKEANDKASLAKGVYMTATVANDKSRAATKLRNDIVNLIETTELNAVVIDIKETDGLFLPESLKGFVAELHKKDVWVIARTVVFNDTVKAKASPAIALKRTNGKLWLDNRGNAWLDPASPGAWDYIVGIGKQAVDYGFDEIQFDYIRFPSDGDVKNIVYPFYKSKERQKYEVLRDFFQYLSKHLKEYKPDIILSADLFGYVSIQKSDLGIGQRMEDIGNSFDFISFMVYPSHYYTGFYIAADPERKLPALAYPYRAKNVATVVSNQPYDVIHRSMLIASDFLAGKIDFTKATSASPGAAAAEEAVPILREQPVVRSGAKLRPWLQDFDLGADTSRGIYYDAQKVRAQIDAAEAAGLGGWLLWNPNNVYTEPALQKE